MRNVLICDGCGVQIPDKTAWFSLEVHQEWPDAVSEISEGDYCTDCKDEILLIIKKLKERKNLD